MNRVMEQNIAENYVLKLVVAACEAKAIDEMYLSQIVDALIEAGCEINLGDGYEQ